MSASAGAGARARAGAEGQWALSFAFALAFTLAGCTGGPAPTPATVPPPSDGGGFGVCHSPSALALAVDLRAEATRDARGLAPGIHRVANASFVFVWASYKDTLRQDNVTSILHVEVDQEPNGTLDLCSQVRIAAPTQVDGQRRSYDVAVVLNATRGLPPGPVRVLVDWVVGCPCDPLPRGNATASFEP